MGEILTQLAHEHDIFFLMHVTETTTEPSDAAARDRTSALQRAANARAPNARRLHRVRLRMMLTLGNERAHHIRYGKMTRLGMIDQRDKHVLML